MLVEDLVRTFLLSCEFSRGNVSMNVIKCILCILWNLPLCTLGKYSWPCVVLHVIYPICWQTIEVETIKSWCCLHIFDHFAHLWSSLAAFERVIWCWHWWHSFVVSWTVALRIVCTKVWLCPASAPGWYALSISENTDCNIGLKTVFGFLSSLTVNSDYWIGISAPKLSALTKVPR